MAMSSEATKIPSPLARIIEMMAGNEDNPMVSAVKGVMAIGGAANAISLAESFPANIAPHQVAQVPPGIPAVGQAQGMVKGSF